MWSKRLWTEIDTVGTEELPGGRYASGVTDTSAGPIRFISVCIPWRDAHVRSGRKDRKPWEDHLRYLCGLHKIIRGVSEERTVIAGDWNQRIPRKYQPKRIASALEETIPDRFDVVTKGLVPGLDTQLIDHAAISERLEVASITGIPKMLPAAGQVTDHCGVVLDLVGRYPG